MSALLHASQLSEVFKATGTGTSGGTLLAQAPGHHALQVFGVGGSPTAWSVVLQGSLDNSHWFNLLTHDSTLGNVLNDIVFSQGNFYKVIYLQLVCNVITLGAATSLNAIATSTL